MMTSGQVALWGMMLESYPPASYSRASGTMHLLANWAPTDADRQAILVDGPTSLFFS